ncbi:2-succinyl-5-enolpyruvyl-6-hydroxy-3-cyclohexene-1-carboxylic-acid synthase [Gleimia sp. 6138-11-ORH1]|uniref:2-succinyl-5-enolpyruvyl-6-hydroxy-3- cyclohexene-1-carboxylic-acid synthase n=1 Tax=Gleimia sp. 6138-11-ORH1 TaxID=2973937 RepID=UPI002168C5E0|nr:2-succinyl-5-enolpyruvyl-6-hydroxy-3-cyclohexene-1-carboxylic-acid synthase [Gleimia sp. 6138-11-ORH1]MCS4483890.1 2-succinyl-5-enolpyruvyl-6-hydroxy-3-cyclohexene-1-carboxylic-acid synthase [Gleimia sp. 6138-11-ORH1]
MNTAAPAQTTGNSVTDTRYLLTFLATLGVRHFIYCPGSRCAPFAYALADLETADPTVKVYPKIDERSAGFFALGIAKATDQPVAVIMTSGTAVAHTLPAVMEAHHTQTPLLIISADRPYEMRGVGASQTTQQIGIFSHFVRRTIDLPAKLELPTNPQIPLALPARKVLNQLRHLARCWQTEGAQRGPAHLNVALREPLTPTETETHGEQLIRQLFTATTAILNGETSLTSSTGGETSPTSSTGGEPAIKLAKPVPPTPSQPCPPHLLNPQLKTALIVGEHRAAMGWQWEEYLEKGYLILAEPGTTPFSAGLSAPCQQQMVTKYADQIEQLIVIGRPTLSRPLTALINQDKIPTIVVAEPADYPDLTANAKYVTDRRIELPKLSEEATTWAQNWRDQAITYVRKIGKELVLADGLRAAQIIWDTLGANPLIAGASNAIRYLDLIADTSSKHGEIFANRGQAGIDGTIAFARGVHTFWKAQTAEKAGRLDAIRTVVFIGDITFLHDASSLLNGWAEDCPEIDIVVLDDGGGRIFASLEHGKAASEELYEKYFAMGQKVNYQALADGYGWQYHQVAGLSSSEQQVKMQTLLSETEVKGGRIIHLVCDHSKISEQIRRLFAF